MSGSKGSASNDRKTIYDSDNPPPDIGTAEERRQRLIRRKRDIELDLGNRNKIDPQTGKRLPFVEYNNWRRNAIFSRNKAEEEMLFLKQWITEQRNKQALEKQEQRLGRQEAKQAAKQEFLANFSDIDLTDPLDVMTAAHGLFRDLHRRGAALADADWVIVDALRDCIDELKTGLQVEESQQQEES